MEKEKTLHYMMVNVLDTFWSKNNSLGENSFSFYFYMCTNIW